MASSNWVFSTVKPSVHEYVEYLSKILNSRSTAIEEVLAHKLMKAKSKEPKVKRTLKVSNEVFKVKAYLLGNDINLTSPSGIQVPLRIAANPAILVDGDDAVLYVRVSTLGSHPIPDPRSRTFICVGRTPLRELEGRLRLNAKPALYPLIYTERVEDPRVLVSRQGREVYHVRAIMPYKPLAGTQSFVLTFTSTLKEGEDVPESMEPVRFKNPLTGGEVIIRDYRDTFPLSDSLMVLRPWFEDLGIGAPLIAPREGPLINPLDARAYPELMPTNNERKTGSNCSVRISRNEYLLIFHGVDPVFGAYHTYAALLSNDGELLAVTPEPVSSPRPNDYFGARPTTLFPCGAALVNNEVIMSAGKDDEVTLVLSAKLDDVVERMKFITP